MSKSVLLCISTLLDGGNRARAQFLEDGKRHDLRELDSRSHLSCACARRLFQNVQPLRLAWSTTLCQHPGVYDRHPLCKCSLFLRPSTHWQISLVCEACLKTDEPEKCVSIQTRAAVRHSLSRSLCRFAGARTSSPRYGTTRLSEKRALYSPTLLLSRLADAKMAVVKQNGDCQGHSRRCAFYLRRSHSMFTC